MYKEGLTLNKQQGLILIGCPVRFTLTSKRLQTITPLEGPIVIY